MDGLDALLAEAASAREEQRQDSARKASLQAQAAQRRAEQEKSVQAAASAAAASSSPAVSAYAARLKAYLQTLVDPLELEAIGVELSRRSYHELEQYSRSSPALEQYTLTQELERMEYAVTAPDGRVLRRPDEIRALHASLAAASPTASGAAAASLLWRCANQSVLGELIGALQSRWMEGDLSISLKATRCAFALDLRLGHEALEVRCSLSLATLGVGDTPLELATAAAALTLEPGRRSITQKVDRPRLCQCVVYEEQLDAVAASLAAFAASAVPPAPPARAGREEATSLDEVTAQLEAFMGTCEERTRTPSSPTAPEGVAGAKSTGGVFSNLLGAMGSLASPIQREGPLKLYRS